MKKSFYKNADINYHILHTISALAIVGLAIYLSAHYFESKFPTEFGSTSGICNISSFFSCDITTFSALSNILGIPIALFGSLVGIFLLFGHMFKSESVEGTNHFMVIMALIFCTFLNLYSLVFLKGLCPMCFFYYLAVILAFFVYFKTSQIRTPSLKVLSCYAFVALVVSGIAYGIVGSKEKKMADQSNRLIKLYNQLPKVPSPEIDAPYFVTKSTNHFGDAPIQIVKFSDFQCPMCKIWSENLHKVAKKYAGKVNIRYLFYPLDQACNPKMTRPLHRLACQAAYLATCLPGKFATVERDIFNQQKNLTKKWLTDYAKKEKVYDCYNSQKTKDKVTKIIDFADTYQIQGTPTLILNDRIIGTLSLKNLYMLLDKIIESSKK